VAVQDAGSPSAGLAGADRARLDQDMRLQMVAMVVSARDLLELESATTA
jgi:hypothetical protein